MRYQRIEAMKLKIVSLLDSLSASTKALKPKRNDFERFKSGLQTYLGRIDGSESEENLKTHLMDLLKPIFAPKYLIEQQERIDFVIRSGGKSSPAAVLVEAKRRVNRADMITESDCNRRAMHELVLYYMRERLAGNTNIQKLIVCTELDFFVFSSKDFERLFFNDRQFRADTVDWQAGRKSDLTTEFFYTQIAKPFIAAHSDELQATHFDLSSFRLTDLANEKRLVLLFKFFSPKHMLNEDFENDSNSLNRLFYDELLHIVGLEERKENGNRVIGRLPEPKRSPASLLENTIAKLRLEDGFNDPGIIQTYGPNIADREFNIALELCLSWINRLLFLKLLEAQVVRFHGRDINFKFLHTGLVPDFDDLSDLFFVVLAFRPAERPAHIRARFSKVPYLNSSLFEKTRLERVLGIGALNSSYQMPLYKKTVLKDAAGSRRDGAVSILRYIFEFLDAFDFGTVGGGEIQEESKTIINASVLGLIFEKINGYREGAIFTPGFVTMYMSKKVIHKTVLEAFQSQRPDWQLRDIRDLRNNITDRSRESLGKLNRIIDEIKICDPAVGSGHFLVSCLNELIALKSWLGILADRDGNRIGDFTVEVDNDELIVLKADSDEVFSYHVLPGGIPKRSQQIQQTLFHEKQKLIENSLFGVDINPNSVQICQLRLWIELLKNAYYRTDSDDEMETLPNIDINIKCGNSLLSRFKLDQSLSEAFSRAKLTVAEYRSLVAEYKESKDKQVKRDIQDRIQKAKARFHEESLRNVTRRLDVEIAELRAAEAQADLFVLGEEQQKVREERLSQIREKIASLENTKERLIQNKVFLSAFEWRFEFPEVLNDKGEFVGFDIVIANPPYMRVQEIEATQPLQKEVYEQSYATAKGSYEFANLFFELAVRLAKRSGNNNIFIFPHKLFNSESGSPLREYLMNTRAIKHLTHFGANQVFESAITYTCIALFNREYADAFRFKRFSLGEEYESQLGNDELYVDLSYNDIRAASDLYGGNQWIFFDEPAGFATFRKLFASSVRLSERLSVFVGLQTSRDSLYVVKKLSETAEHFKILVNPDRKSEEPPIPTREFEVEKRFFRPFLMGKDVRRYGQLETDRLVFFPYEIGNRAEVVTLSALESGYPKTYAFVMANRVPFEKREKGRAKELAEWYAYIYEKNLTKFEQPKLTSMEICTSGPNITLNREGICHSTTVYSLAAMDPGLPLEFYAGLLNSSLFWWFIKATGDTLQGDARRLKTNYFNPFPLPASISAEAEKTIVQLVRERVTSAAEMLQSEQRLDRAIDQAIYGLYNFDSNDIGVIERALTR
jgi:hypothetical protein